MVRLGPQHHRGGEEEKLKKHRKRCYINCIQLVTDSFPRGVFIVKMRKDFAKFN